MQRRPDEEFRERGPAPGAEQVFANDPEMLALIRKGRERQAEPGPRRKPWWWQAILVLLALVGAALATLPAVLELVSFHPVLPASGLLGGACLAFAILGHRPGSYRITDSMGRERERTTLWKPIPALLRVGAIVAALALPALGFALQAASP